MNDSTEKDVESYNDIALKWTLVSQAKQLIKTIRKSLKATKPELIGKSEHKISVFIMCEGFDMIKKHTRNVVYSGGILIFVVDTMLQFPG